LQKRLLLAENPTGPFLTLNQHTSTGALVHRFLR
jgi:hypothetical protein